MRLKGITDIKKPHFFSCFSIDKVLGLRKLQLKHICFSCLCFFSIMSCVHSQEYGQEYTQNFGQFDSTEFELSSMQKYIQTSGEALLGLTSLNLDGVRFSWDCSGTTMACLFKSGMDIRREYGSASGTGVERFHKIVTEAGLVHDFLLPEVGDLIFWDNTHDRNGDKAWNDELTHVGIVLAVDDDGTITYLHHDYRRGIIKAYMNLLMPDLSQEKQADGSMKVYNSAMRMSSQRYLNPNKWLSSHLFRSFARIHLWDNTSIVSTN